MAPKVSVVDDDISVRESLESLIRSVGLTVRVFASAEEFLNSDHPCNADCLVLDVQPAGHERDRTPPSPGGPEVVKCRLSS